jgi:hypothetical protein
MRANLVGGQRYPVHLELEIREEHLPECLELPAGLDRHIPSGRVAVGEVEHRHGSAVLGADAGHLVQQGVRYATGR